MKTWPGWGWTGRRRCGASPITWPTTPPWSRRWTGAACSIAASAPARRYWTPSATPHGPAEAARPGPHPAEEEARLLAEGRPFAWRLSLERAKEALGGAVWDALSFIEEGSGPDGETGRVKARPETAGDVVLARKDAGTAYHLAVTHDDALQGISHVIRGQDLFEATHIQRLIQALMDWPAPVYRHHRLLAGPDGRRYAKRDRSVTLAELREGGLTPEALRAELGF